MVEYDLDIGYGLLEVVLAEGALGEERLTHLHEVVVVERGRRAQLGLGTIQVELERHIAVGRIRLGRQRIACRVVVNHCSIRKR